MVTIHWLIECHDVKTSPNRNRAFLDGLRGLKRYRKNESVGHTLTVETPLAEQQATFMDNRY